MGAMHRSGGFTYLTVLFVIAFMGIGLALTGEVWHTAALRDKEAQLLYTGSQYRRAIERYYLGGPRQYPRSLDDLLKDPRKPNTERYLRKRYFDPVTGSAEWGLVKGPDDGIMGVYSLSELKPMKSAGFDLRNRAFEGAATYADWKFVYDPAAQQIPIPGTQPPGAALPQSPLQPMQPPAPGVTQSPLQAPDTTGQGSLPRPLRGPASTVGR
jgi:type II secretory pathway pseudopilin PulG